MEILVQIVVGVSVTFFSTVLAVEYKRWREPRSHARLKEELDDQEMEALLRESRRQGSIGACLGGVAGLLAGLVVWLWWREPLAALVIAAACGTVAGVLTWRYARYRFPFPARRARSPGRRGRG